MRWHEVREQLRRQVVKTILADKLAQPSRTAHSGGPLCRADSWREHASDEDLRQARRILDTFGLDGLYRGGDQLDRAALAALGPAGGVP